MATRVGSLSGKSDSSTTSVTTSASIAVAIGDAVFLAAGWEDGNTTCTPSSSVTLGQFDDLGPVLAHSNASLCVQGHWLIATSAGTATFTATLGAGRGFKRIFVEIFRPASGMRFSLDTAATSAQAQGSDANPTAGTIIVGGPGGTAMYVKEFSAVNYTPGSGWTEDIDSDSYLQYQLPSASISVVGTCTSSGAMDWASIMAHFLEGTGISPGLAAVLRPRQGGLIMGLNLTEWY